MEEDLCLFDAVARAALDDAVLYHTGQLAPVCAVSAEIVSGYSVLGQAGEVFVPISLLRLAHSMDQRDVGRCLTSLLSCLPHTREVAAAIDRARRLCANEAGQTAASCGGIDRR